MIPSWCSEPSEIARLLRWLASDDRDTPIDLPNAISVVEKPWKWIDEYAAMLAEQEA